MPRLRRRPRITRTALLTEAMLDWLRTGHTYAFRWSHNEQPSDAERRDAWEAARDDLITDAITDQPGTRPAAFWQYDHPNAKREGETDAECLQRLKLLRPEEKAKVAALLDDPITYYAGRCRGTEDAVTVDKVLADLKRRPVERLGIEDLDTRFFELRGAHSKCLTDNGRAFMGAVQMLVAHCLLARGFKCGYWLDSELDILVSGYSTGGMVPTGWLKRRKVQK